MALVQMKLIFFVLTARVFRDDAIGLIYFYEMRLENLIPPHHLFILAQESRRVTVRLKTGLPGCEAFGSREK